MRLVIGLLGSGVGIVPYGVLHSAEVSKARRARYRGRGTHAVLHGNWGTGKLMVGDT